MDTYATPSTRSLRDAVAYLRESLAGASPTELEHVAWLWARNLAATLAELRRRGRSWARHGRHTDSRFAAALSDHSRGDYDVVPPEPVSRTLTAPEPPPPPLIDIPLVILPVRAPRAPAPARLRTA